MFFIHLECDYYETLQKINDDHVVLVDHKPKIKNFNDFFLSIKIE